MTSLTQFRSQRRPVSLQPEAQPFLPAISMPGLPAPGAASVSLPGHTYPADGPTVLGYTVTQLQALDTTVQGLSSTSSAAAAAAQSTADTALTNAATAQTTANSAITTANAALPKAGGTMTGNLRVNARIGINTDPLAGRGVDYAGTNLRVAMTDDFASWGNNFGLLVDKVNKASIQSNCTIYAVGTQPCWASGMDVGTNNSGNSGRGSTGNADFIPVYDYTGGWNDDGTRSVAAPGGIDVLRFTPAEASSTGKSTQWDLNSGPGATRNTTTSNGRIWAGKDLSGILLTCNCDNSRVHLLLEQRATTHQYAAISLNQRWIIAQDITATNAPAFTFYDSGSAASNKSRMYIEATNAEQAKVGFNTISPVGLLSVSGDAAAAHFDVAQPLFAAGYSNGLTNRTMSFQVNLNGSAVKNYLLLNGTLGTGTVASPTLTSAFAGSMGLESSDSEMAVVYAAQGTNVALSKATRWNVNGNMGFYGVAPVARPTVTGSRASGAALADLLTKLASTGIIIDSSSA